MSPSVRITLLGASQPLAVPQFSSTLNPHKLHPRVGVYPISEGLGSRVTQGLAIVAGTMMPPLCWVSPGSSSLQRRAVSTPLTDEGLSFWLYMVLSVPNIVFGR